MKKKPITYQKSKLTRAENLFGKVKIPSKDLKEKGFKVEVRNSYWQIKPKNS